MYFKRLKLRPLSAELSAAACLWHVHSAASGHVCFIRTCKARRSSAKGMASCVSWYRLWHFWAWCTGFEGCLLQCWDEARDSVGCDSPPFGYASCPVRVYSGAPSRPASPVVERALHSVLRCICARSTLSSAVCLVEWRRKCLPCECPS